MKHFIKYYITAKYEDILTMHPPCKDTSLFLLGTNLIKLNLIFLFWMFYTEKYTKTITIWSSSNVKGLLQPAKTVDLHNLIHNSHSSPEILLILQKNTSQYILARCQKSSKT